MPMERNRFVWLDREALRRVAGERTFARGAEYHALGQVLSLAEYRGVIAAVVQGTRPYRVQLRAAANGILSRCDCPAADRGESCKHAVAAGLAFLEARERRGTGDLVALDDVADRLRDRTQEDLVALLLDEALESRRFRDRMLLDAANRTGKSIDLDSYLRALDLALSGAVWNEGEEAGEVYLIQLKSSLGALVDAARWNDLRPLLDHGLKLLADSKRPSPASQESLRAFYGWLRELRARIPPVSPHGRV